MNTALLTGTILTLLYLRIALVVVFNVGIVVRIIIILMQAQDDEEMSPKKAIKNHIVAAVVVNLAGTFVILFTNYFT